MAYYYRGAGLRQLNSNEFLNDAIPGESIPVVDVSLPDGEEVSDYRNQTLSNIEEFVTTRRDVQITGGATDTLPAAVKFTKTAFPPGVVLVIDASSVPTPVEPIQYDPEWFDANPGVLAHVSTLYDGELREGGRITALLDGRESKTVIFETRRTEIENEGTANRVTTEREVVAFAPEIRLDNAVTDICIYRGTTGTSPYTLARSLYESPQYRSKLGDVYDIEDRSVAAYNDEYRKQAELLHAAVEPAVQYDTTNMNIVAVDSFNDIRADKGRIEPENFRFVYNGRGFDESYERNSHLLGGGR